MPRSPLTILSLSNRSLKLLCPCLLLSVTESCLSLVHFGLSCPRPAVTHPNPLKKSPKDIQGELKWRCNLYSLSEALEEQFVVFLDMKIKKTVKGIDEVKQHTPRLHGVDGKDLTQEREKERKGWMGYGIPFLFGEAEEVNMIPQCFESGLVFWLYRDTRGKYDNCALCLLTSGILFVNVFTLCLLATDR